MESLTKYCINKSIVGLTVILFSSLVFAHDVYDAARNQLSISSVRVGNNTYSNVLITVDKILSVGGQVDATTPAYDLKTIYENLVRDSVSHKFSFVGSITGSDVTGTGIQTVGSVTAASFRGGAALAKTSNITMNINIDGQQIPSSAMAQAYYDHDYNFLGQSGFEYEVVTDSVPFPAAARLNDAGIIYNSTIYTSSSMSSIIGTQTASYSIAYESESTMNLTLILIKKDTNGSITQTQASRYRIGLDNSVTPLTSTLNNATTFLTISY